MPRLPANGAVRQRVARTSSVPAPVLGWNARDSIAAMKPRDAYILTNWFPEASRVVHRKGSMNYSTIADVTETMAAYKPPTGAEKLFGWTGGALYDMSAGDDPGTALVDTLTNSRWQTVNISTSGGHFMYAVNGSDDPLLYDGTTWQAMNGTSTPTLTGAGLDVANLINVNIHKQRVWFIEKDTTNAWYLDVDAIGGALHKFPLGSYFRKGGTLIAMGTWTVDGGTGTDDFAVFITSGGEVAVYAGVDPADATDWHLVGIYSIGSPIGLRCLLKLGGDLMIITTDGVVSASKYLITARTDKSIALTDRIQTAMSDAIKLAKNNFGWELTFFPAASMLILNVPLDQGSEQFVMNTITGAWSRFTGWPAACFCVFSEGLYFGQDGGNRHAWIGPSDNGDPITSEMVQAFNYFGNRNQQKQFRMVRPVLGWDINPAKILLGIDVDFQVTTPTATIFPINDTDVLVWDVGRWDTNSWGGNEELKADWYAANGIGFAGAVHMLVESSAAGISYSSCDIMWEAGSVGLG
jgi:hypothetical protein